MARIILTGIVLLLVSSLMAGCGIAQEQYDAGVNEQAKAQQAPDGRSNRSCQGISLLQLQVNGLPGTCRLRNHCNACP